MTPVSVERTPLGRGLARRSGPRRFPPRFEVATSYAVI